MMREQTLTRCHPTPDGIFGRLGQWTTVEEEDQGNQRNISAIPAGTYICRRTWYNTGGYETFEVCDVPQRTRILFHIINTEEDTEGCIGITSRLGVLEVGDEDSGERIHKLAGLSSRVAFSAWMADLEGVDEFVLRIVDL